MSEWVRTADRVPEEGGEYLMSDGDGFEVGIFDADDDYPQYAWTFKDDGALWDLGSQPTHWRAIRSPYEIARERAAAMSDEGEAPIMSNTTSEDRLARLRVEVANLAEYMRNAPHAEFSRANVEAVVQVLLGICGR